MLLPGMNCSGLLWESLSAQLRSIDGRIDIRPALLTGSSIDDCVTDLLSTLPARFALAGLSLGGIVAMALVRQAPERVSRLCLMSTNPHAPTQTQVDAWAETQEALVAGRTARDIQQTLLPVLLSDGARTPRIEATVLRMADQVGSQSLLNQLSMQATRVDERDGLSRIDVPTLILSGERDLLCPVAKHEEVHGLVTNSDLVVLGSVGHLSPLESPGEVGRYLGDWLRA